MLNYKLVKSFDDPYVAQIQSVIAREWGYHYIQGFGIRSKSEYQLWKNDSFFMVALDNDSLIGFVGFERYNVGSQSQWTPCICNLWIEEPWRNQGVATVLVSKMVEIIKFAEQYKTLYLWLYDTPTVRWFENRGWKYLHDWRYLERSIVIMYYNLEA